MKLTDEIRKNLIKKAKKSQCKFKVSAVAFDKKGSVIGQTSNTHSRWAVSGEFDIGRSGTGEHAEASIIARYGHNVKTIVICRVGRSGILRPIKPCPACEKLAKKMGVRIISIEGKPS